MSRLPAALLEMFIPRPPMKMIIPPKMKKKTELDGIAAFMSAFDPNPPKVTPKPNKKKIKAEAIAAKLASHKKETEENIEKWKPSEDINIDGDIFKTILVARLSHNVDEARLRREMEQFGPVASARVVYDKDAKPRGYAFVEFEHERHMKDAFRRGDGRKIDGRRVLIDVVRAGTVNGWLPRRLGGGLGGTRNGGKDVNVRYSGRAPPQPTGDRSRDYSSSRTSRDYSRDDRRDSRRDDRREERSRDYRRDDRYERREDRGDRGDRRRDRY